MTHSMYSHSAASPLFVAGASSAAAQVFEKRYERSSPRGSSENLLAHASIPPSMDVEEAAKDDKSSSVGFFCGSENTIACVGGDDADAINEKKYDPRPPGAFEVADLDPKTSSLDEGYQRGVSLHGGAFNSWAKDYGDPSMSDEDVVKAAILLTWVRSIVVGPKVFIDSSSVIGDVGEEEAAQDLLDLLGSRTFFNKLCYRCVKSVNEGCLANSDSIAGYEILVDGNRQAQVVELAKFLERIALATDTSVPPPFDQGSSAFTVPNNSDDKAVQELILDQSLQELIFRDDGSKKAVALASFLYQACRSSEKRKHRPLPVTPQKASSPDVDPGTTPADTVKRRNARGSPVKSALKPTSLTPTTLFATQNKNLIVPKRYPSPFETSVWNSPSIVPKFLSFLGDPAAVCRMKAVNRDCHRIISDNEHVIMKTAVRLGGLEMHLRPSFWMWITLEKCRAGGSNPNAATEVGGDGDALDLQSLSTMGEEGRWHHTIMRDVTRSFGNMPPHKSGQKLRKDSIVRALVFYGQGRLIKRGVKGGVDIYPRDATSKSGLTDREHAQGTDDDSITSDQSPTDTVSDWGAVSPVGSTVSMSNSKVDADTSLLNDSRMSAGPGPISQNPSMQESSVASIEVEDIALCPRDLTNEVKEDLQSKLGFILHALATSNDKVGYCQGMDTSSRTCFEYCKRRYSTGPSRALCRPSSSRNFANPDRRHLRRHRLALHPLLGPLCLLRGLLSVHSTSTSHLSSLRRQSTALCTLCLRPTACSTSIGQSSVASRHAARSLSDSLRSSFLSSPTTLISTDSTSEFLPWGGSRHSSCTFRRCPRPLCVICGIFGSSSDPSRFSSVLGRPSCSSASQSFSTMSWRE